MFQTFNATTSPNTAKSRVAALRAQMAQHGVDGFWVPRSDAHMGEYVAPRDQRLAWLTSFTGSAGFSAILSDRAGLFVDGRYTIQAKTQVDTECFEILNIPNDRMVDWLNRNLPQNAKFAYDPWLHTSAQVEALQMAKRSDITLIEIDNLVDQIWDDQPDAPLGLMVPHDIKFAGIAHTEKLACIGMDLHVDGQAHVVLTQPDSIAWVLNTRGTDLGQTPVALCFAIIHEGGTAHLFIAPEKVNNTLRTHLGKNVIIEDVAQFNACLESLVGSVQIDPKTAPIAVQNTLMRAGIHIHQKTDPTTLPKACKNTTELAGAKTAHIRDGAAMVEFLAYVAGLGDTPDISEIDLVTQLETYREATGELQNISFDTICGSGPNGAIVHYRVNTDSNRQIRSGDVLLVDSGAQYFDGTTDITRTIAIGKVPSDAIHANTLVLKGMIAISSLRFPSGLAGRDIDAIARHALWSAGLDFDHGTGHGVGSYLSVHEGPQGISRRAEEPLRPGMILSNEPGYYKEGAYGIRIENLIYVTQASPLTGSDARDMLAFETLTLAPIDRAMINVAMLTNTELNWLNTYHLKVSETLKNDVSASAKEWLEMACAPL